MASQIKVDGNTAIQDINRPSQSAVKWTTAVLAIVGFLAAVDRQSFAVLLVPIQKDLQVSDAAMGALSGSAFALIYAFVALPLARLADRMNRRNLISIAVVIWSAATAVCGVVHDYALLMLARIGVGGGEAALQPATMSIVGDLAPAERRGALISVLSAASLMGFAGGGIIAGVLNDHFGWHVAMLVVGLPGLLLAIVMYLTVPEPIRGVQDGGSLQSAVPETMFQSLRRCSQIRTLYPFVVGLTCLNIGYSGWTIWMPAFLMRVHHLSATSMGGVLGVVVALSAVAALIGGPLSDRLARRGAHWRLYYCGAGAALAAPLLAASTLAPALPGAIAFQLAFVVMAGGINTVAIAAYLSVAPASMRAVVTAVMNIIAAGLGGGLAPILFGFVNDIFKHSYGDQSLRYTLLISPLMMVLTCVMFLIASRTIDSDVKNVQQPA